MGDRATKGILAMPSSRSTKAPSFTGGSSEALELFEHYSVPHVSSLSKADKCRAILYYVNTDTKHL